MALFLAFDSSLTVFAKKHEMVFDWKEIKVIKFRKHNGFMRTVVPIALLTGATVTAIAAISYTNSLHNGGCGCLSSEGVIVALAFPLVTIETLLYGAPTYFITRNHTYPINSYNDFLKLKQAASKYTIK